VGRDRRLKLRQGRCILGGHGDDLRVSIRRQRLTVKAAAEPSDKPDGCSNGTWNRYLRSQGLEPPAPEVNLTLYSIKETARYVLATALQFAILTGVMHSLDGLMGLQPYGVKGARVVVAVVFFSLALRSRVFSPLDARRPMELEKQMKDRKFPSWMPPGIVFPIVWSTIAILRSVSACMIWESQGYVLCEFPLLLLALHLCIGDTWNHINNVEKRLGVAVIGVVSVWISIVATVYGFYMLDATAGLVLLPSAIWISVATVLVTAIWDINGRQSLIPRPDFK